MKLGEIADQFQLELKGDSNVVVDGVGTIERATGSQIAFLANPKYRKHLPDTSAAAVILSAESAEGCPVPSLVSQNPYASYARIASLFDPAAGCEPGVHASAVIADDVKLGNNIHVGPLAVIEAGCRVGDGAVVGARCHLGRGAVLKQQAFLHPGVTIYHQVQIGARSIIHSGAVIGADGFGIAHDQGAWVKVPQLGSVVIGNDCEVGANTTIDRGAIEDTILGDDVKIDNQVQIGHNVRVGDHTAMAGCAAIAGSTTIGKYCLIGGGAGVVGHLTLCDGVTVGAMSLVTHSIHEPGEYASGTPLQRNRDWRKNAVRMRQLDDIARRVKKLER